MTKAEIAKYLLLVGSEPVYWSELMRAWLGTGWSKDFLKFSKQAGIWLRDGYLESTQYAKKEGRVSTEWEAKYRLTDKAIAKLQGKRSKV